MLDPSLKVLLILILRTLVVVLTTAAISELVPWLMQARTNEARKKKRVHAPVFTRSYTHNDKTLSSPGPTHTTTRP